MTGAGCASTESSTTQQAIDQTDIMTSRVMDLESKISALEDRVSNLELQFNDQDSNITSIQSIVSAHESDLSDLQSSHEHMRQWLQMNYEYPWGN